MSCQPVETKKRFLIGKSERGFERSNLLEAPDGWEGTELGHLRPTGNWAQESRKRFPGPKLLQRWWEGKGDERGSRVPLGPFNHPPALLSSL